MYKFCYWHRHDSDQPPVESRKFRNQLFINPHSSGVSNEAWRAEYPFDCAPAWSCALQLFPHKFLEKAENRLEDVADHRPLLLVSTYLIPFLADTGAGRKSKYNLSDLPKRTGLPGAMLKRKRSIHAPSFEMLATIQFSLDPNNSLRKMGKLC